MGYITHMAVRNSHKISKKTSLIRVLRRTKHRWNNNIKMHIKEIGFEKFGKFSSSG
jgi:hypothetical protein